MDNEKQKTNDPVSGPLNWRRFIPTNWQSILSTTLIAVVVYILSLFGVKSPVVVPPMPAPVFPDNWVVFEKDNVNRGFPTGWTAPREEDRKQALATPGVWEFKNTEASTAEFGDDVDIYLWKASKLVRGQLIPTRNQGSVGSCVSFGFGAAYEYAVDAQIASGKSIQEPVEVVQELLYGGGRVESNGGRSPIIGDGSTGSWQARWLATGGAIKRGVYGSMDLRQYDQARCRLWGKNGVPDELEPIAKPNTASCALVLSAEDLRKALAQKYPVAVCSNQGFSSVRDSNGFASPQGEWGHCMVFIGYRSDIKGFYCLNSWGEDWISGPIGPGEPPPGGFWVRWDVADRMMKQRDSYAVSNVKGFPKRKLDVNDWIIQGAH